MLTPTDLDKAGELVAASYTQIEAEMLDYLVGRMIAGDITGQRSQTALLLLAQSSTPELNRIIEEHASDIDQAVVEEVSTYLGESDERDLEYVKKGLGVEIDGITTQEMAATVKGIEEILSRQNLGMVQGAKDAFIRASTEAIVNVNAGVMTTERALHKAVRDLEGRGISVVQYVSESTGKKTVANQVDVAVRRHVRTQIAQDGARRTEQIMDEAGIEFVEVSSHTGARPSHQEWEGRVYSRNGRKKVGGHVYEDFRTACHVGDVADGIYGANCRHSHGPYIPGMERTYKPNPQHPSGLSNDEVYSLTQKQRALERDIRKTKRELSGAQLLYDSDPSIENQVEVNAIKQRLRRQQSDMRDLIDEANAKCKPGTSVLQRSQRREWAGDMPKAKRDVPGASGRTLDDYMAMPSTEARRKASGMSKAQAREAVRTQAASEGVDTKDFKGLSSSQQNEMRDRAMPPKTVKSDRKIPAGGVFGSVPSPIGVTNLSTRLIPEQDIEETAVFAGAGTSTVYRKSEKLAQTYGGTASEWFHSAGTAWAFEPITGKIRKAEFHWAEEPTVGIREFRFKNWCD